MQNIIANNAQSPEDNRRLESNNPSKDIFDRLKKRRKPSFTGIPPLTFESPCRCGSLRGKFGAGRKPRESSLICGGCGIFICWVSEQEIKALLKGGES